MLRDDRPRQQPLKGKAATSDGGSPDPCGPSSGRGLPALAALDQAVVALCVHRRARGHATAMPECTRIQQTVRPSFRAQRP